MSFLSRSLLALGATLLLHAAYSAHEHSALQALAAPAAPQPFTSPAACPLAAAAAQSPLTSLPADIALETLVAVALLGAALVLGAEPLRPVRWAEWAAGEEAARRRWKAGQGLGGERGEVVVGLGLRGYEGLEPGCRRGFLDIRAKRKAFAEVGEGEGRYGVGSSSGHGDLVN